MKVCCDNGHSSGRKRGIIDKAKGKLCLSHDFQSAIPDTLNKKVEYFLNAFRVSASTIVFSAALHDLAHTEVLIPKRISPMVYVEEYKPSVPVRIKGMHVFYQPEEMHRIILPSCLY